MEIPIKLNLPNILMYHIVYTKRTNEMVMYSHMASVVEYTEYTSISFTDK